MTDYPDYQTPQAHANAIAATGAPPLRLNNLIADATNQTLAGGGSGTIVPTTALNQPAVQLFLKTQLPLNAGTIPFVKVQVSWKDGATGQFFLGKHYYMAAGNNVALFASLLGPVRGDFIQVILTNLDPAQTLTYTFSLLNVSHFVPDDYWLQDGNVVVNGFTVAGGDTRAGVHASVAPTIAASSSTTFLLPANNQKLSVNVDNSGQLDNLGIFVGDPSAGGVMYSLAAGANFYGHSAVSAGAIDNEEFQPPAGPLLLTLQNVQSTNSITPKVTFTSQRFT